MSYTSSKKTIDLATFGSTKRLNTKTGSNYRGTGNYVNNDVVDKIVPKRCSEFSIGAAEVYRPITESERRLSDAFNKQNERILEAILNRIEPLVGHVNRMGNEIVALNEVLN